MKLCYVTSVRLPTERPHGYAVAKMCEAFASNGHEVVLMSPNKVSGLGDDIFSFYRLLGLFRHVRIPTLDLLVLERWSGRVGYWVDFLSFVAGVVRGGEGELRTADVIYVREPYLALFLPKRKVALEMHTMPSRTFLMRWVLTRVHRLAAISHGLAQDIEAFSGRKDIIIIPDAVDLRRFSDLPDARTARERLGLPLTGLMVAYTGNFYQWKGVDTLADAACLAPKLSFVLVGGTDEADYQRIAAKAALAKNLIVRRFEEPSRIPLYLAAADVLVIPNAKGSAISERHTSPLKLFEYLAVGKPIVASDVPSIREILDDKTGIFFPAGAAEPLVQALKRALDPMIAKQLGDECLRRSALYSWEARAETALAGL